jgi:outer membrane protein OmpA-like peptidoglycan-associated protein
LTPEAEKKFQELLQNIKKYYNNIAGDVEVITSASIDADPVTKEKYNMDLSMRRANKIIERLKSETGNNSLRFIPKPIGQTEQFAPGLKYPKHSQSETGPNRRLIIKLPKIKVQVK